LVTQTNEVMRQLSNNEVASVSKMISDTIGKPSYADNVQNAPNALTSKKIGYSDKVVDHSFGKGLRQIVYYCFVENIGFVYFRFNYKMSNHGWILANFNFKTETNELFPKDFVDPQISMQTPPRVPRLPPIVQHTATVTHRPTVGWAATLARSG